MGGVFAISLVWRVLCWEVSVRQLTTSGATLVSGVLLLGENYFWYEDINGR